MANLSRRDFLRFAGKGAFGAAAASLIPGMVSKAESAPAYMPGTYTATGTGRNGDVTVTMTFDETSITDIIMDVSCHTLGESPRRSWPCNRGHQSHGRCAPRKAYIREKHMTLGISRSKFKSQSHDQLAV